MTRRSGLSLTEVLVALFIMAIGLIAILTMFPLGALQMGQALKDDRTAQAASNADGFIRWYWKQHVTLAAGTGTPDPFVNALDDPNASPFVSTGSTATAHPSPRPAGTPQNRQNVFTPIPADDSGPSYPVVIDPMGFYRGYTTAQTYWLGLPGAALRIPRRNLQQVESQVATVRPTFALRTCSLLDGTGYDANGRAVNAAGQVERDMRYNWLWVLQRPNNRDRKTVGVTVVVFDKRAHQYLPRGRNPETAYNPSIAQVGQTRLTFASAVPVQKGGWIADVTWTASFVVSGQGATAVRSPGVRNFTFYRVVSVTENGGAFDIELQTPLRADAKSQRDNRTVNATDRRFLVMDGVSEVFERSPISPSDLTP